MIFPCSHVAATANRLAHACHVRSGLAIPRHYAATIQMTRREWRTAREKYGALKARPAAITRQELEKERYGYLTTVLIIVLIVLLIGGGGWYGRGRWY